MFARAFVVWVCCGFCLIIFVWDFVAGCTECLGVFVQLFFLVMDLLLELSMYL